MKRDILYAITVTFFVTVIVIIGTNYLFSLAKYKIRPRCGAFLNRILIKNLSQFQKIQKYL